MEGNGSTASRIERLLVEAVAAYKEGSEDNAGMLELALQGFAEFNAVPVKVSTQDGEVVSADVDLTAFLSASLDLLQLTVDMVAAASGRDRIEVIAELRAYSEL